MALSDSQQLKMARQFARQAFVKPLVSAGLTVTDLKAAANDLEAFIATNSTAINNALPVPFRTTATTPQKRLLLALVACEMAGIDLGLGD